MNQWTFNIIRTRHHGFVAFVRIIGGGYVASTLGARDRNTAARQAIELICAMR